MLDNLPGDLSSLFVERSAQSPDWLFLLLVLQVVLVSMLRLYYPNRALLLFNAYVSNRFVNQLTREERSSQGLYSIIVEVLYFISFTLFLFLLNQRFQLVDLRAEGFFGYLLIGLGTSLFMLVKILLMRIMVWIFDMEASFGDVYFYRFLNHGLLALALLPFLILELYFPIETSTWIILSFGILALSFIYRLIRSARRFWLINSFSVKYIILYICALEILPLCLMVKFMAKGL